MPDDRTGKPDKGREVSSGRRAFFRDLFVQAVEVVERAGREFHQRATLGFDRAAGPPHNPPAKVYPRYTPPGHETYGPPWPPPAGPPLPIELIRELNARAGSRVARNDPVAGDSSTGPAAPAD